MKRVFGDTHYFLALLNPRDQYHAEAVATGMAWDGVVVTTHWVLAEVADGLATLPLRRLAVDFLTRLRGNRFVQVIPVSEEQFHRGFELYSARTDKEWSLTDCISFVAMEQEGIREALTGDRHFQQAGFVAVFAP